MGRLQDEANAFRRAVNAKDQAAIDALLSRYVDVWNALLPQVRDLAQRIEERRKSGLPVSSSWLYREERYKSLLLQLKQEMEQASRFGDEQTRVQVAEAFQQGAHDAESLLSTATGRSIGTWNRLPTQALNEMIALTQPSSPISALFAAIPKQAQMAVRNIFLAGLAQGLNPKQIARSLRRVTEYSAYRAATIARTETLRAYRTAAQETYRANDDVVLGWVWLASLSTRTCPVCLALHGKRFPLKRDFGTHPNCRCTQIPVTDEAFTLEDGESWFSKQADEKQAKILGKGKYEAYKDGRIRLSDLVGERDDSEWGLVRFERSLRAALKQS
jgi:SPP1 gp7 family putative phage head morphogenesis protein